MLLLLDIDVVMVQANSWKNPEFLDDGFAALKSQSVKALQKIISKTDAAIILTTSHRSKHKISEWDNIFQSRGIIAKHIDRLPDEIFNLSREEEFLKWYMTNRAVTRNL